MHRALPVTISAVLIAFVGVGASPHAQGFGSLSKFKKKAEEAKKKAEEAKEESKKKDQPKEAAASKSAAAQQPKKAGQATTAKSTGGQPDMTAVKIDFVPGERTVFYDDFSDMAPDEPPPHWKVRGGEVALKMGGGLRELAPGDGVVLTSPHIAVPADFTMEIVSTGSGQIDWSLQNKADEDVMSGSIVPYEDGKEAKTSVWCQEGLGEGTITGDMSQPLHFALWAQHGRVRAYLNGERLVDANQVEYGQIDHLVLHPSRYRPNGIRSVRIAESSPDVSTVLAKTGKYVSHGIYFDTDSDRLKPESAGVIRTIASALIKNPNLKLAITGYTDSTGNPDHNVDLSKRRAEAVRSVLVSQFAIDASRLTADGKGANDPVASNDTADGRAQNRRVEFVKQ